MRLCRLGTSSKGLLDPPSCRSLNYASSGNHRRGPLRRKRNPDISREGRLLAKSRCGQTGNADRITVPSEITVGRVSRTASTSSQERSEPGASGYGDVGGVCTEVS